MTEEERPLGLWDYGVVLWRRRTTVLVATLLTLGSAALIVALRPPPPQEATARYRGTDADLVAEAREALALRMFPLEEVAGLDLSVSHGGRGLRVTVSGDPSRARAFLTRLPEHFRVSPKPTPASAPEPEALPSPPPRPVPALPPGPPPAAPTQAWQRELGEVEARLPRAGEAERAYLTARALRLRDLLEQARREEAAALLARERHVQEMRREREQYEQQVAAHERLVAAELARRTARAAALRALDTPAQVRELVMVHPVVVLGAGRPWGQVLLAASAGGLVLGVCLACAAEWFSQERARRAGGQQQHG